VLASAAAETEDDDDNDDRHPNLHLFNRQWRSVDITVLAIHYHISQNTFRLQYVRWD